MAPCLEAVSAAPSDPCNAKTHVPRSIGICLLLSLPPHLLLAGMERLSSTYSYQSAGGWFAAQSVQITDCFVLHKLLKCCALIDVFVVLVLQTGSKYLDGQMWIDATQSHSRRQASTPSSNNAYIQLHKCEYE
jgi:hypothetical protein